MFGSDNEPNIRNAGVTDNADALTALSERQFEAGVLPGYLVPRLVKEAPVERDKTGIPAIYQRARRLHS